MHLDIIEWIISSEYDPIAPIEKESFGTSAIVVGELPKLTPKGLVCNEEWPVPPEAANRDSGCDSPCRSDRTTGSQSTGFLSASKTLPRVRKMPLLNNLLSGSLQKPFDKDSGFYSGLNTQTHTGGLLFPSACGHEDVVAPSTRQSGLYQPFRDSERKIGEVSSITEEGRTNDDQEPPCTAVTPVQETRCRGSTDLVAVVGTTEVSRNQSGTCPNEPANLLRVETCTQVEGDSGRGLTYLEHQRVQRLGSPFITRPLSSERIRLSSASSRQDPEEVAARVPPAHGTPSPEALREDDFHTRLSPGGFTPARSCSNREGRSVGESSDSFGLSLLDNRVHQSRHGPLVNEDSCFASDSAHHQAEGGPKHGISSTDCTGPTGCTRETSVGGVCEQGRRESPDPASDLPLPVQQGVHLQSSEDTEVVATRDVAVKDAKNFVAVDMNDIPLLHLQSAKLRFSRKGRTSFEHGISTGEVFGMATTLHGETPLSQTKQHPYQSHPADHQSKCTNNTVDKELAHKEQPNLESQNNQVVTKQMRECTLMSLKAMRNMADRYTVLENGTTLGYVCYSNCAVISQGTYLPLPSSVALSNGIGRGGNGLITNIYHGNREFAVKQTLYRHLEVEVLSSLSHKHILPLEAVMMGEEDPVRRARYLCYHFYPRLSGDLQGYLSRLGRGGLSSELMSRRESQDQLRRIVANTKHLLAGVLRGLAYLHRQGIVHNDIKPSNILLQLPGQCPCPSPFLCACPEELGVVITDFDSAMSVEKLRQTPSLARLLHRSHAIGTPGYRSIEYVLAGTRTTEELTTAVVTAADIWALGCSVLKMFIAHAGPHSQREMAFLRLWSCSGQAQWRVERQRAREMLGVAVLERVFPQWEQLVQLVDDCMQVDPLRRARAEDLLDHPFFSS